jgi:hypothetical protein
MNFKDFLGKCPKYENLYILEETGNRKEIVRTSRRHGKVTEAKILLFDSSTRRTTVNEMYINSQGYFIIRDQKRLRLEKFK